MENRIDSVLVPTDGSEPAARGATRGIDLAARTGADLHVLSAVEATELEPPLDGASAGARSEQERVLEAAAEDAVDGVAERASTHLSGAVTTTVERGAPSREIADYVDEHDVDVVVMGTHGRTGLERVLGSVANRTLRTATVPVVVVPPDAAAVGVDEVAYDDVLLPTDASEGASVAVDWGVSLATTYDGQLHAIYSVDTSWLGGLEDASAVHDALAADGEAALEAIRRRARDADVSITGTIATGRASSVILSYVDASDVDLVVMGTHGRSGLERYLIGSVTEGVVRNATVPVCCVPMPAD